MTQREWAAGVFDDLAAEYAQFDAVLGALEPDMWARESAAVGWTVSDVVLHLAQTEELVLASAAGDPADFVRDEKETTDEFVDRLVREDRGASPEEMLERWRSASRSVVETLRNHPPDRRIGWATIPLSPRTLATTRIAEHWAHALDITVPLGIDYLVTSRLRHIAWLAHRTLPYAFVVAGEEGGPVRCELTGPGGEVWRFGDADAPSVIKGSAEEFCRVGAQRLAPEESTLTAEGPHAAAALRVVRNYAA